MVDALGLDETLFCPAEHRQINQIDLADSMTMRTRAALAHQAEQQA